MTSSILSKLRGIMFLYRKEEKATDNYLTKSFAAFISMNPKVAKQYIDAIIRLMQQVDSQVPPETTERLTTQVSKCSVTIARKRHKNYFSVKELLNVIDSLGAERYIQLEYFLRGKFLIHRRVQIMRFNVSNVLLDNGQIYIQIPGQNPVPAKIVPLLHAIKQFIATRKGVDPVKISQFIKQVIVDQSRAREELATLRGIVVKGNKGKRSIINHVTSKGLIQFHNMSEHLYVRPEPAYIRAAISLGDIKDLEHVIAKKQVRGADNLQAFILMTGPEDERTFIQNLKAWKFRKQLIGALIMLKKGRFVVD